jgi:hypothetical protein
MWRFTRVVQRASKAAFNMCRVFITGIHGGFGGKGSIFDQSNGNYCVRRLRDGEEQQKEL